MDDETKEWIVRAVLLFCAIVIAGVSVYTTFMLFSAYQFDLTFSPPGDAAQFSPPEGDDRATGSFDIDQEHEGEDGLRRYKAEPVEPFKEGDVRESAQIGINPLVISEHFEDEQFRFVFVVVVLEIIAVFFVYRVLDRKVRKNS